MDSGGQNGMMAQVEFPVALQGKGWGFESGLGPFCVALVWVASGRCGFLPWTAFG